MQRPHNSLRLDVSAYLDQAERDFLISGKVEFVYPVRRGTGDTKFYEELDRELRGQDIIRVHSLREVKEAFTWISRPAALTVDLATLLKKRPHLSLWRGEIETLTQTFDFLDVRAFLESQGAEVISDLVLLRSCLEVLSYLVNHREKVTGLLPRQLPHGQSTKLIGRENLLLRLFSFWREGSATWRDFYVYFELLDKPLEFRFFAPLCTCQNHSLTQFHGLLAKDWASDYEFSKLGGSLIVENLMSQDILERYRSIQQKKDIFLGPFRSVPGLQSEYEFVSRHGIQIEQEQMRESWPFGTNLL
jgi:hypothetical protein